MIYLYYTLLWVFLGLLTMGAVKISFLIISYPEYRKTKNYIQFKNDSEIGIKNILIGTILWPLVIIIAIYSFISEYLESFSLQQRLLEWYDKKAHPEDYL